MHEMLAASFEFVILKPIAPYRQDRVSAFLHRYYIRQGYARCIPVLVFIRVAIQIKVNVHLQQLETGVYGGSKTLILRLLLLNLVHYYGRFTKINIPVEPSNLQPAQLILGLTHPVRHPLCAFQIRRPVRDDDVFRRDVNRCLPIH